MKKGGVLVLQLVTAIVAILCLTACVPAEEKAGERAVKIGMVAPLTGGAATIAQVVLTAEVDYIRYFNQQMTIPGVALELMWVDTAMDQARIFSAYRRLIDQGVVALTTVESATLFKEMAERDQIPVFAWSITEKALYPPGWIYAGYPTDAERFAVLADWIMENWKEDRAPRIGFVTIDREYGRDLLPQSEKYAKSKGMEWLPTEFIPYIPLDSTAQLLRMKERGADFVYIGHMWTTALPVLKDAARLGLMGEIRFCGWDATFARALIQALGPAAEGYFVPRTAPLWNEVDNPGIKWANEMWRRYHGLQTMPELYEGSLIHPPILPEAIKRAIEKVGYEDLDGLAVKEALDTIENFDPYGFGPKITYTNPEVRRGSGWIRICQVQNGDGVPVTDWREAPILRP